MSASDRPSVICDINRDLTFEDYCWAKHVFVDLCADAGIPGDKVGFFGGITSPGISDIDALAVGSIHQIKRLRSLFRGKREQSKVFSDLFWHSPVYVLDEAVSDAPLLHTLDGLAFIRPQTIMVSGGIDPRYRLLLNMVWFSFLVRVVSCMLRRDPVSLRMLLLVHKNIEFSLDYFSERAGVHPPSVQRSSDLRRRTLSSQDMTDTEMLSAFQYLYTVTCDIFHEFSSSAGVCVGRGGEKKRFLRDGWRLAMRRGDCLSVRWCGGFSLITLPELLFEITRSFLSGRCEDGLIRKYIIASHHCAAVYRSAEIEYPFVTPLGVKVRGSMTRTYRDHVG